MELSSEGRGVEGSRGFEEAGESDVSGGILSTRPIVVENCDSADVKWPFWTEPEISDVHVTTEREAAGVSEKTSWAEWSRWSSEYMLMRWLIRNGGSWFWCKVLNIMAWMARASRIEEGVDTA